MALQIRQEGARLYIHNTEKGITMENQCYICGAPKEHCANISRAVPFTLYDTDETDTELVRLRGEVAFWCDGSEPDVYYFHPMTGRRCEDITQCFAGWSEQDPALDMAWEHLQTLHANDGGFPDRAWAELTETTPKPRTRVYLERLKCKTERDDDVVLYRGEYVDADDAPPVRIDMGFLGSTDAWWSLPLPPCPDCEGAVVWRENGYVSGARGCVECGSMFSVEPEKVPDLRGARPETVMDGRISLLLDDATNTGLPTAAREQLRNLWQRRNSCPDWNVEYVSRQMIDLAWQYAAQ